MRSRPLSILVALWWLTFTCLIIPGHTRGAIGVDGTSARTESGKPVAFFFANIPSCCNPKPGDAPSPPGAPSSNCVVCKTVAHVGMVPALATVSTAMACVGVRPLALSAQVRSAAFLPTFQGRAPPAARV